MGARKKDRTEPVMGIIHLADERQVADIDWWKDSIVDLDSDKQKREADWIIGWLNSGTTRIRTRIQLLRNIYSPLSVARGARLIYGRDLKARRDGVFRARAKNVNCVEHWLNKGMTLEQARQLISSKQNKNSLESIMGRTGCTLEEAKEKQHGFTERWRSTFANKSAEDMERINRSKGVTLEKMIQLYGETEGKTRWEVVRAGRSHTSTDDIKRKQRLGSKFSLEHWLARGFNEEDARKHHAEACKARSHFTLARCVSELGEERGRARWERRNRLWLHKMLNHPDRENFIKRGTAHSHLAWWIEKYGEDEGLRLYRDFLKRRVPKSHSMEADQFFSKLEKANPGLTFKYGSEELSLYDKTNKCVRFYDCHIPELNMVIEYHGCVWHADPRKRSVEGWKTANGRTWDEAYAYDQHKAQLCIAAGYNLHETWDYEDGFSDTDRIIKAARSLREV